jgi:hypothetical protein
MCRDSNVQNSKQRARTTQYETWNCIYAFLNAYRTTSPPRCLATSTLPCKQYSWHAWTCNLPQFIME